MACQQVLPKSDTENIHQTKLHILIIYQADSPMDISVITQQSFLAIQC